MIAAMARPLRLFPHRDATVDKVIGLTTKAATQSAGLPATNGTSSPVSTRKSTT
jgi:hypothetical protein